MKRPHLLNKQRLDERGMLHHMIPLVMIVLFAVVGVGYLVFSSAASGPVDTRMSSPTANACLAGGQSSGSHTYVAVCNGSVGEEWQLTAQVITNRAVAGSVDYCLGWKGTLPTGNTPVSVISEPCNSTDANEHWVRPNTLVGWNGTGNTSDQMANVGAWNSKRRECLVDPNNAVDSGSPQVEMTGCGADGDQYWFPGNFNPTSTGGPSPVGGGSGKCTSIIACAHQYDGIPYATGGGPHGTGAYTAFFNNCINKGISARSACQTDCSGFVSAVIDQYYKKNYGWTVDGSANMSGGSGTSHWQSIPMSQVQPGDIVTRGENGGHVEFFVKNAGGLMYTIGAHQPGSQNDDGQVHVPEGYFSKAFRFKG